MAVGERTQSHLNFECAPEFRSLPPQARRPIEKCSWDA
jgi:hypothetical protein